MATRIVDADLSDYFGSIPHAELLHSLARRIVDRRVLHLLKQSLECTVEETDKKGRKTRTTEAKNIRRGKAEEALRRMHEIMNKLKLTVNEEKTRICKVPEEEFDFLGYTFGRLYSTRSGKAYLGMRPSKKSIKRMVEKIHAMTARLYLRPPRHIFTLPNAVS